MESSGAAMSATTKIFDHRKVLAPEISEHQKRSILTKALTTRFVEEELLGLFSRGKLNGTVHTCIGQEFCGAVLSEFLRPGDTIFSNHRCHGHFLSRTDEVEGLVAELMGRRTGVCAGIGGSQHLCKDGFFSNGIQGGIVPVAAGLALGHKLRGTGSISVVFIGDGTLGEGVVYETLNLASKWDLPLLMVLEDNKYSQSTAQHETLAGDIRLRAEAFGIETAHGNTWDWQELWSLAGEVVPRVREGSRPLFLHVETYRLKAHSKGDDTRPRAVVEPYEQKDPLNEFLAKASPEDLVWIKAIEDRVKTAVESAECEPAAVLNPSASHASTPEWHPATLPAKTRFVAALNETLAAAMREQDEIIMIGEDIEAPYGGAFKVTRNLSDEFPRRVRNTPISEAAIVGIGTGLGLLGFRPLVEIMFGDFAGLAFDQILNHAAKFGQMYNSQVQTNVIVRTPMGGGRGYGPTHSQTLDKHFLGIPGLTVLALNCLLEPKHVYGPLLSSERGPALVIENKLLYGSYFVDTPPVGFQLLHSSEPFPDVWIKPESAEVDLTLLGYGGTAAMLLEAAERLFDEHDLVTQVLCVTKIYPFSVGSIAAPILRAPRLLVVEEGQGFAGFASEVISQLAERDQLASLKIRRLHPAAACIPSSGPLEKQMLPSVEDVIRVALEMHAV